MHYQTLLTLLFASFLIGMALRHILGQRAFKYAKWILTALIGLALIAVALLLVAATRFPAGAVLFYFGLIVLPIMFIGLILVGLLFAGIAFQRWLSRGQVNATVPDSPAPESTNLAQAKETGDHKKATKTFGKRR